MTTPRNVESLKPFEARSIIESLRKGTVPVEHVPLFTVGRERWLKFIEEDLETYISQGGSKVRFINGDYGDGKTHFMSVVRHLALEQGLAVSFVVLTRETPIHKFEVVYQSIVRQLTGQFEGNGIHALVGHWLDDVEKSLEIPQAEETAASPTDRLAELAETVRELSGMDLNFANALLGIASGRLLPLRDGETNEERSAAIEMLFQWLEGARLSKRDLKPYRIFEVLNKTNSKRFLGSLLSFLRHVGHKGLVLLMDELETVLAQSTSVRNASYENVRLMIDNTEHSGHLHVFFSIIPDVIVHEKGFKSYDALWSRVRSVGEHKRLNYRSVLVDLHRTPLETSELVELGKRLRRIHELAYRWSAETVAVEMLEEICAKQKKMGVLAEVRLYVKHVIRLLDMAEQGEPIDQEMDMGAELQESQRELESEKLEQLQPKWDD